MRLLTIAVLAVVFVIAVKRAEAQPPSFTARFDSAQVNLDEHLVKIQRWENAAKMSWIIVVAVGLLGIMTAALQAARFKRKSVVTALIGGLVSGATVYGAATIPADYKTLDNLAAAGRIKVKSAMTWLEKGRKADNDGDRQFALDEIEKRLTDLARLGIPEKPPEVAPVAGSDTRWLDGVVTLVHAAEMQSKTQCGCFVVAQQMQSQRSTNELIACGTASGATLSDAHDRAVYEAAKNLAAQLNGRTKTRLSEQQLVDYVRRVATELDSCPGKGKKTELSVVLRMPESLAREQAMSAFATGSSLPVRLKVTSIRVVHDGSTRDTGWTFDILVDGRLVTRIPARDYSDKPTSRTVTLTGANAIEVPIDLPKGNYWLVEIKGQRTKAEDKAIGAAAVSGVDKPVEINVANPTAQNGSFVFTITIAKS